MIQEDRPVISAPRLFAPLLACILLTARFQCSFELPLLTDAGSQPVTEYALRITDLLLMEPGFTQARELSRSWRQYTAGFSSDEKRAKELEQLANEPAITGYLNDPDGRLAPAFKVETAKLLNEYAHGAITAWRLRALNGKILLGHNEKQLKDSESIETKREIGPRYFTIPIQGTGFNFSLDGEWDISRLPDFPLSQISSEYMFFQTDHRLELVALPNGRNLPDAAYRFVSGGKFVAPMHGVQNGMRVISLKSPDHVLIICYPFAGLPFYAVRGAIVVLLLTAVIFTLARIGRVRGAAQHVLENRSGKWLEQHYQQSLSLNDKAINLADNSLSTVQHLKAREEELFSEIGRQLQNINRSFNEKTQQLIEETLRSQQKPAPAPRGESPSAIIRPLHKKAVHKDPILIAPDVKPEIQVAIELDLPLKDEQRLPPAEKTAFVQSLRRRAQAKSAIPEYIHDEKIDNYDYVPAEPLPEPKPTSMPSLADESAGTANLEYVQKFRYSGKNRVLPMATVTGKDGILHMREDLHREELLIAEDE